MSAFWKVLIFLSPSRSCIAAKHRHEPIGGTSSDTADHFREGLAAGEKRTEAPPGLTTGKCPSEQFHLRSSPDFPGRTAGEIRRGTETNYTILSFKG